MIDCAVIIVAYRSADDLPALLASLPAAAGPLSWAAVVVDNYGRDHLDRVLEADPRVSLVSAGRNLGYSGGLNLGIRHAPASRFTVFLNPDLVLEPGALAALAAACGGVRVGATVPLVLDDRGTRQHSLRNEPTLSRALGEAMLGDHWPGRPHWLSEMVRMPRRYSAQAATDWATGAALMVRSEVLAQVGAWDARRFFLYSEETDYSRRLREAGHTIAFAPDAVVRHTGAGSGSSVQLEALLVVNKLRYYRKWHPALSVAAFFAVSVIHQLLRVRRPGARAALRALFSRRARAALPGGEQ
jgi:N-acetylglucosaminyl-diphospho-decaprenol L-rhamnosyltransferase